MQITLNIRDEVSERYVWAAISRVPGLTESFIRENADKLHWFSICEKQKLSEELIEEFSDKVHWVNVTQYQNLSEAFIEKHFYKLSGAHLCYQANHLSKEFKEKC